MAYFIVQTGAPRLRDILNSLDGLHVEVETRKDKSQSVFVSYYAWGANRKELPKGYSAEFTKAEVLEDCAPTIFKMLGLRVVKGELI